MTERRLTRQFEAVRDAVTDAGRPLSIDEIHTLAQQAVPSIGQRTVYRAVRRLEEDGDIAVVRVSGQPDRYESAAAAAKHHHHFRCVACDRLFDVHGCPGRLERLVPEGFVLEDHEITLTGRCDRCA